MSGTATVHRATLTPTKQQVLSAWLPGQEWFGGDASSLTTVGSFRFADPDGEVGVETLLVSSAGTVYHVPLTYRAAPLEGADDQLVGRMQHSVLGERWVYDATADPVYVSELTRVIREGDTQCDVERDGQPVPSSASCEGSGVDAVADTAGLVRIVRALDDPHFSTERARGLLTVHYTLDGQRHDAVVAVLR